MTRSVGVTSPHKKKAAGDQRPEFGRNVRRTIRGGDPPDRKDILNIGDLACRELASAFSDGCSCRDSAIAALSLCLVEGRVSPIEHVLHGFAWPHRIGDPDAAADANSLA